MQWQAVNEWSYVGIAIGSNGLAVLEDYEANARYVE
jgi:hypothetical protein